MNMLSYSAAQDPFHAIFRILSILRKEKSKAYEVERVYIYDFYVCFPWQVGSIDGVQRIPGFIRDRNYLKRLYLQNEYEQIPEPRIMLKRMRPAQLAALNSLASYGFLVAESLRRDKVERTNKLLPAAIAVGINEFVQANKPLFDFIEQKLDLLPLAGPSGLKAKTGLEEFRYDYV